MRAFVFAFFAVVAMVSALPLEHEPNLAMIPDGEGNFKLVNLNDEPEPESFFNPNTDTVFLLFTRDGAGGLLEDVLDVNDVDSVTSSRFNPAHPTRCVVVDWK